MLNESCPIDHVSVDEHAVRATAALTITTLLLGYYLSPFFYLLVFFDFLVRSLKQPRFSPFAQLSKFILNLLHIPGHPIDRAPKLFATRIGLLMASLILLFLLLTQPLTAKFFLLLFLTAATLEAFFNYCLGCKIYSLLTRLNLIKTTR